MRKARTISAKIDFLSIWSGRLSSWDNPLGLIVWDVRVTYQAAREPDYSPHSSLS
jgi:hypothetical protein